VSSLLKGGSSHTELALAMREFSLVGKWVEVVRDERLIRIKLNQISDAI
jgi:hypothetical protein